MNSGISTGDMLRDLRLKHNVTQQQISMQMGVNVRTYRRWENNESSMNVNDFIKLLNFYKMKVDVVLINDICRKDDLSGWLKTNY